MVFNSYFKPKPFWDLRFRCPGGVGRSQGTSAELVYLTCVRTWGKSQTSCLMPRLSWKRESLMLWSPGQRGFEAAVNHCGSASSGSMALADDGLGPAWHSPWLPRPDRYLESCGWLSRNRLAGRVWTSVSILGPCSNCIVTVLSLFFRKCHKPVSPLVKRNIPCQVLTVLQNAVFYLG